MGKRIKVYAGCYELYITDKEMPYGFSLCAEFETVPEAEAFVDETEDWLWIDRDLLDESGYCWDGDDFELHTFDFSERTKGLS